ncbi:ATP-binding cassette domain-containing protein [Limibaculum sp. FT325]|uniref:cell division ATP-binding protein FtsE n=1 Tax=Thermohalobaculum sediminis TaxID=2939436 RepID=UPI0020BE8F85|nr:ATP-binding cassette domain-containing protein [Limibaculum sediminis]MCL5778459.1 ATP-binding cassette domain-containing protein [Limibaculum sediminis]
MISLDRISFGYDGRATLEGVEVTIPAGSFHFLTGPSGAGKTTLLKLIHLEHRPHKGSIALFGENIAPSDAAQRTRLRRRIGVVFQDFRLIDHMSVADNIALPLRLQGKPMATHREDVTELVEWVGLTERADALPRTLSAGEKQRAAIARAVITSPELIIADEPTGNIDAEMGMRILRLLVELNRLGKTVLVATHDLGLIRAAKSLVQARTLRLSERRLLLAASEL